MLQKILEKGERAVSHPYNKHTHNKALERIFSDVLYLPLQNEEMALAATVVRKGPVLASLKSLASLLPKSFASLKSRLIEERQDSEISEIIKSMSGYLSNEKASVFKTRLQACPYTQTEAYLKWIMKEDFEQGGNSQQQIETFLRKHAKLPTIQTPPSPFDQHYVKVLTQALENEKKHSDKAVFYHASDPWTCFLWHIISAYRSLLQLRGEDSNLILRALDDKFSSILDVEAFIKNYQIGRGNVDNYATVGNIHYADRGLSVNPGIPGSDGHSTSSTYYLFYKTTSVSPVQQEALFNYFMLTLGIPGEFKNYEALFNQYYSEGPQANALLLQIFIDPQVLDSVSYMALAGGTVLTLGGTAHPDHRFGSYLSEIRTDPDAFNERLKTQGQGIEDLNRVQGRLYLKPEIFHNREFVSIETYWHHPMKSEAAYWDKLNCQIMQDLTECLLQHTCLPHDVFFDGQCSLKKMYRYVYEGQLQLSYREKSFKFFLSNAIRTGNMRLIHQIFETHPEIDLNEGFPNQDYRSDLAQKIVSPFNVLSPDTPNFSEVVQFLVKKKAKKPHFEFSINNTNLEDKLLNEFVGVQDHLSPDFLTWTTASLERKFNFSRTLSEYEERNLLENLVDCYQNYKHMFSFMRDKIEKFLRSLFLEEEKIEKEAEEKGTSAGLIFSPKMMNMTEVFLVLRDAINIPGFTSFWNHIIVFPNDYIQKFQNANKDRLVLFLLRDTKAPMINLYDASRLTNNEEKGNNLIGTLASNTNLKTLKISGFDRSTQFLRNLLTDLRLGFLETLSFEAKYYSPEILETMAEGLKGNTTLKELKLPDDGMRDVMINLMSLPQGPFTNAAWFIKARAQVHQNPGNYFKEVLRRKNYSFALGLLQETSCPIKLSTLTSSYDYSFLGMLIDSIQKNTAPHSIDLSDIRLYSHDVSVAHFSEAIATNTNVQFLDLTNCFFDKKDLKTLASGLKKNHTLQKISLNGEERIALMTELMKMERPFRSAPWFSFMRDEIEEFLRTNFLEEETANKMSEGKGTSAGLTLSPKMINTIESFSILRDSINIPELNSFCDRMFVGPNDYIQKLCASGNEFLLSLLRVTKAPMINLYDAYHLTDKEEKSNNLIEALASNSTLKTLRISLIAPSTQFLKNLLTDPRLASLETLSLVALGHDQTFQTIFEGLKSNETLKELILPEDQMMDIMINLMSLPQGAFTSAPWFIKAKAQVPQNPGEYLKKAFRRNNYSFALGLLQNTSCSIKLSTFLTSVCDYSFLDMLIDSIQQNTAPHSIDLSDFSFSSTDSFSHLSEALATNTTVQFLDLTSRFFDSRKGKILALGLQKNNTLQEISLSEEERIDLMKELMKMEGPFRSSPWFTQAWKEIISSPVKSLRTALHQKNLEIIFPMITETPSESLDLSEIAPWDKEWIPFAMRGLVQNKTIQALTLNLNGFKNPADMNYLAETLRHTKPLVRLTLKGISELCLDVSSFIKGSDLFETLKMSTTISVLDLDFSSHLSRYSPSPLDALIPFLENTNIRTIVFRDYYFSPSQAQLLTKSCLENSSLKMLDLSQCFLMNQSSESQQETMKAFGIGKEVALARGKTFLIPAITGA